MQCGALETQMTGLIVRAVALDFQHALMATKFKDFPISLSVPVTIASNGT